MDCVDIVAARHLVHEIECNEWDSKPELHILDKILLRQEHFGLLRLVDVIRLVNEVRNYGLFLVLSQELLPTLGAHFPQTLVEDAATSHRSLGFICFVFALDYDLFLLNSDPDNFLKGTLELFPVALKFISWVSNLCRLALLI